MLFRVARAWHFHFVTCSRVGKSAWEVVGCDRCNTPARFSKDDLHFVWQARRFGDPHRHFAWHAQHFRGVVWRFFLHMAVSGLCQVLTACKLLGKRVAWWECHLHGKGINGAHAFSLECHFGVAHAVFRTLYTVHWTFRRLHSPLFTLHALHFTLYTPHFTLHTLYFTLHTLHFKLRTLHFTLRILHFTLRTLHFALCTPALHFGLNTPKSPLHALHTTFPAQHSAFFTLPTLHSTPFRIRPSTAHCFGNRRKMYKTVQIICFTEVVYATALGFVGCILCRISIWVWFCLFSPIWQKQVDGSWSFRRYRPIAVLFEIMLFNRCKHKLCKYL